MLVGMKFPVVVGRWFWRLTVGCLAALLITSTAGAQAPAAASPEVTKWLTQTSAQFDASYQKDVHAPFEANLAVLRKNYLASVNQAMETATTARKLDEAQLYRAEREKFLGAGHKPPDDDSDNPPDTVRALRSNFRKQFAQLDLERFSRAKALHAKLDPTLAQTELALTQKQRTADAALIRAKREEMSKTWLQPAAQAPGEAKAGTTAKAAPAPRIEVNKETIRQAVEWVLSVGGEVFLPAGRDGRQDMEIKSPAQLPSGGSVTIAKITLENAKLTKPVQDADLAVLAGLRSVRFLDLRGVKLSEEAFGFLDGWKDLEKVHVNGAQVTDAFVTKMARFDSLHALQIRFAPVTGKTCDKLAGARNLRTLDLERCGITDDGMAVVAQLKGLEDLNISRTDVGNAGMAHVASLTKLKKLNIQDTKATAQGLASLGALRELEELSFLSSEVADYPGVVKQIATTWPRLQALRIVGGEVRADMIEPLVALRGLKGLYLQGVDLGEPAMAALAKLTTLEELGITQGTMSDEKLGGLTALKKIRMLRLNNTKVTDTGIMKLKTMKGLKELEVRMTPVTLAGAAAFEKELPGCRVVRGGGP
jgi:hypothetical protein